jgi:hypothetical protein
MSSVVYGALTAQREAAPEGTSKEEEAPGFGSYVDVVAALVPAEILAANAALLPLMAETSTDDSGNVITTIQDPANLKLVFWLSIVFSIALYVIGDRTRARVAARKREEEAEAGTEVAVVSWNRWNTVRALIPAGAYVAWTMLQKSTATRLVIAVFGAIALGAIAKLLSDKADNAPAPEPAPVAGGGDAGGGAGPEPQPDPA